MRACRATYTGADVEPVAQIDCVSYRLVTASYLMAHLRNARWKHTFGKGLLILALPTACAVGVEPDSGPNQGQAGTTSSEAGTSAEAGNGTTPMAGSSSSSGGKGGTSATGGTSSGGKSGSSTGGSTSQAGKSSGGSSSAGAGGSTGGASAGASGAAGAGGGGGVCGCAAPTPWVDNTTIALKPGDCVTVGTANYAYLGTTTQQYANKECNPTMQAAWCTGQQFIFMLCP